ncbi:MAG: hypothetical protein HY457_02870 [Parcubacteria group bacterium]|nr:hypothetical protein [Parcubacteria group bacterium]
MGIVGYLTENGKASVAFWKDDTRVDTDYDYDVTIKSFIRLLGVLFSMQAENKIAMDWEYDSPYVNSVGESIPALIVFFARERK